MPMKLPSGLGRTLPIGKSSTIVIISTIPLKNLEEYISIVLNRLPNQPIRKWVYAELFKQGDLRRTNLLSFLKNIH